MSRLELIRMTKFFLEWSKVPDLKVRIDLPYPVFPSIIQGSDAKIKICLPEQVFSSIFKGLWCQGEDLLLDRVILLQFKGSNVEIRIY